MGSKLRKEATGNLDEAYLKGKKINNNNEQPHPQN